MPDALRLWGRHWPRALVRALLPCACALCGGASDAAVCAPCQAQFMGRGGARCPRCANPLPATAGASRVRARASSAAAGAELDAAADAGAGVDVVTGTMTRPGPERLCGGCLARGPAFDATVVAADYALPLDQLVMQLKFNARLALAPWCALALRDAVLARPGFELPTLLCPVPLGRRRLAERGYNQALEIARPLAASLGIALHPRLAVRARDTQAQSGVAPGERQANVRNAFVVAADGVDLVRGQHIGIVDDVMTSGRTLDELARMFKRFGAARVSNLVFARTPPH
jgi:ComF family protein